MKKSILLITVRCLFLIIFFSLSGCATQSNNYVVAGTTNKIPYGLKKIENSFWWRCQFRITWPENEPNWAVDLLLAHNVISPVLANYESQLPFWRFHRRAVRDDAGHQFSFIFYSTPETASSIYTEINKSKVLSEFIHTKVVDRVLMGDINQPKNPNIQDTSDPSWSPEIQNNWPSYIMGVSSLWLGLIIEDSQANHQYVENSEERLEQYKLTNMRISEKWRTEGQHAFLHHLSAIYGYQPMRIRKNIKF